MTVALTYGVDKSNCMLYNPATVYNWTGELTFWGGKNTHWVKRTPLLLY